MTPEEIRRRQDEAPHADDGSPMPCVSCGMRPWGFGYCGEECHVCAECERCGRQRTSEESPEEHGLCSDCVAHNDGRVVL